MNSTHYEIHYVSASGQASDFTLYGTYSTLDAARRAQVDLTPEWQGKTVILEVTRKEITA